MARCGLKIGVFERNAWIGGGCTAEEPILPGFRCNLHSNFYIGFSQAPLMRDLELARYGLSTIAPPVQHGVTLRDGTALTIHKDVNKTCASIARFSKRDAEAFRDLHMTYAVKMRPLFTSLLYNPPLPPDEMRARNRNARQRPVCTCWSRFVRRGGPAFRRSSPAQSFQIADARDHGRKRAQQRDDDAADRLGTER